MRTLLSSVLVGAGILWPLAVEAQTTPDLSAILERLDRLERENKALSEEVKALKARLDGNAAPQPAVEEQVTVLNERVQEQAQTKVESSQKFPIRIAGMALFNAYHNSRQAGGFEYPSVATDPGPRSAGATVRQTIIGLDFGAPQTVWGGRVRGSLYMDFFGGVNNQALRLRTASIELDWKTRSIMAGLEKPIFNPREPASLAQVGVSPLTGSGNLWLWIPQVKVEQDVHFTQTTGLRAQAGVVQTREVGPYAGSAPPVNLEAARPGLEGRFELYHALDDQRRFEIAPGFHTSQTHVSGRSVPSNLFSLDWFLNPWRRLEFTGAFYTGQNVTPLGAGYQQGYGIYYGHAEAVASRGGWAQATLHTWPRLDFHFFSGQQDDDNSELNAGRIGKNLLFGGNVYYRIAPNVIIAFEMTHLRTAYIATGTRINNHYDLALAYLF